MAAFLLFVLIPLFFFLLLFRAKSLNEVAYQALRFSAQTLIPALFPFSVLARFLLQAGLLSGENRFASRLMRPFSLPSCALPALLIGLFCGFPMGALSAATLWESQQLSHKAACRLAAFGGNAGAAFLLVTASTLFQNRGVGLLLFVAQSVASVAVGLVLARKEPEETDAASLAALPSESTPSLLSLAADCVVKGGLAMLSVASFVVFFAVLLEALGMLPVLSPLMPFLAAFFETSAALRAAASLLSAWGAVPAVTLAAFSVGFTGLSVFLQAQALFHGTLSPSFFFKVRLAIALLSALLTFLAAPLVV